MTTVLVTGSTGEVARGVRPFLEKQIDLKLFAPDAPVDDPRSVRGDVLDWQALQKAMDGVDAVLHLAIAGGHSGTYEEDGFNDRRFDVNVKGTYHVFETARRMNVRRVVQVSSLMVTWGRAQAAAASGKKERVSGDAHAAPVGTYALTKYLGEEIARHFAGAHGMEVITLRIAAPLDPAYPPKQVRPQQVPFPDLAQAFIKALTMPITQYEVVSVCGQSADCPWSLDAARRVLQYEPSYDLDQMGLVVIDPFAVEAE